MFDIFPILFFIMFCMVFGLIAFTFVRGFKEWNNNNHSPRLAVEATVVAKRTNVSRHSHHHGTGSGIHHSTSTTYYVTFQVESGDRMELRMAGHEFGLLIEGDKGKLTFQGTRYLSFQRM